MRSIPKADSKQLSLVFPTEHVVPLEHSAPLDHISDLPPETIPTLEAILAELERDPISYEPRDLDDEPELVTLGTTPLVQISNQYVSEAHEYLQYLRALTPTIPKDSIRLDLTAVIDITLNEVQGSIQRLEENLQQITEAQRKEDRSLETLRRYERGTRQSHERVIKALRSLLRYLKKSEDEDYIVGFKTWTMKKGQTLTLATEKILRFDGIERKLLWREAYMKKQSAGILRRTGQAIATMYRRKVVGEVSITDLALDQYTAIRDGAELSLSSDIIGTNIVIVNVKNGDIIARPKVFGGSEDDVQIRLYCPLGRGLGAVVSSWGVINALKRLYRLKEDWYALHGPAVVYQRFSAIKGGRNLDVILEVEGDVKCEVVREGGRPFLYDVRNIYFFDAHVAYKFVPFGRVVDQFFRGLPLYNVEFYIPEGSEKKTGRVWWSTSSNTSGYWGHVFSPLSWVKSTSRWFSRVLGGG